MSTSIDVRPMGPRALLISTGDRDAATVAIAIRAQMADIAIDVVPAASTVLVRFKDAAALKDETRSTLTAILNNVPAGEQLTTGRTIEVSVRYDGEDLDEVARQLDMSVAELVEAHTAQSHRAAFVGFSPGFAYLSIADPRLTIARRATPRIRVRAGSVALAAGYTAVYPVESPGGWHILGYTQERMWDPSRTDPALIAPGDLVRFVAR
ncbi:MAG: 5-oxoprolinase subunit B family protein [Ilumatobacteraceae bacterium]